MTWILYKLILNPMRYEDSESSSWALHWLKLICEISEEYLRKTYQWYSSIKNWSYIIHSSFSLLWKMIKYQSRFLLLSIRNDSTLFLVSFLSLRRIILIFFFSIVTVLFRLWFQFVSLSLVLFIELRFLFLSLIQK